MSDISLRHVAGLIQEVGDSTAVLLDMAIFPSRIHSQDEGAFPEHARWLLAMKNLTEAFGLTLTRTGWSVLTPPVESEERDEG